MFVGVVSGAVAMPALAQSAVKAPPSVEYVKTGKMFDSHAGKYVDGAVLVVEGARIRSVEGAGFAIPSG